MEGTVAAEARGRVTKWIEETRQLLALLPELLETDSQVSDRAAVAEREVEKLRKELEALRKENQQLRAEKDEVAQAMGQLAHKLGMSVRKSPFDRLPPERPTVPAGDAGRPPDPARPAEPPRP